MNLRAGLLEKSSRWEQVFRQEGFPVGIISGDSMSPDEWSVVVINRPPTAEEIPRLSRYLEKGGGILACSGFGGHALGTRSYQADVEYVTSKTGELFGDVALLDLGVDCMISSEANLLPTEDGRNSVFAGVAGKGCAVELPFDPSLLLFDSRRTSRLFHTSQERLPSEEVSLVGKHELRILIHHTLKFLHHAREIPYAHLWYFPDDNRNLFAFRIDTDGADQKEIRDLYLLGKKHDIHFSWYLDVPSHEPWLDLFGSFEQHEMGVHCYRHRVFDSRGENSENIRRALDLMRKSGLQPEGFAAPFGQWNTELAAAIDEARFLYSSEFSYAYDTFPIRPDTGSKQFSAMQIPVHPVCIGALRRVGYPEARMKEYFRRIVDRKICRNEPLFFYHHPGDGSPDVVDDLFTCVREYGVKNMTLAGYAHWWKKREEARFKLGWIDETIGIAGNVADASVRLEVLTPDGMGSVTPLNSGEVTRSRGEWKKVCSYTPPGDLVRTREFDVRTFLAKWYNVFLRKLR